jgi:hypothetical protein
MHLHLLYRILQITYCFAGANVNREGATESSKNPTEELKLVI